MIQKVLKNKKAFTLVETIIVIVIIGILMMGTTVYFGGTTEKRKIIEAQGCANTILGEMNNYAFYALTSKSLIKNGGEPKTPYFYGIKLVDDDGTTVNDGGISLELNYCDNKIHLNPDYLITEFESFTEFKTLTTSNTCRQNSSNLRFGWDKNISGVIMNKGFSPVDLNENRVFYLVGTDGEGNTVKYLTGDLIISVCLDNSCENKGKKEFAKRSFDGRTQTISLINCAFYNDDNTCKTWEGCLCYSPTDPTECKSYTTYNSEEGECTI